MYNTYIYIQCHFPISNDYTIKCKQGFSKTLKHSKSKPSFRPSHSKGKILTVQQPIVMSLFMTWPSVLHIGTIQVIVQHAVPKTNKEQCSSLSSKHQQRSTPVSPVSVVTDFCSSIRRGYEKVNYSSLKFLQKKCFVER